MSEKFDAVHSESLPVPGLQIEEVVYTEEEAKNVRRRLDLWIMPMLVMTFLLQYWDKSLISQASLFGITTDLNLITVTGYDSTGKAITSSQKFANCSLMFYVGYFFATYPMALLAQRFPTAKFCAVTIFLWAIVMMSTAACQTYVQFLVNRILLGMCESGIQPTFTVYVTFWWTRSEQALRTGIWYGVGGIAMMFTPLISYGLGHIHGSIGSPWRYMYLVVGSITMLWSFIVLWVLPDDPMRAKWLNDKQRAIVIARIKENNAGVVERRIKLYQVWEALKDFNLWSNAWFVGLTGVPNGAMASFSGLVISSLGFNSFTSLLLMMPLGFVLYTSVLVSAWFTQKYDGWRNYMMIICSIPPLIGSLMCWLRPKTSIAMGYAGVLLLPCVVGQSCIGVAQTSSNVAGHTKKATISGVVFITYCIGNVVGVETFASTPGPAYTGGWLSCLVYVIVTILLAGYSRWHLGRENKRRDREYGPPGNSHALEDLTDRENKDFRYKL